MKTTPHTLKAAAPPAALELIAQPGGLEIQAAADEGKNRRFSMLAYSGGLMCPAGFMHPVVVDLAGMAVGAQKTPVLRSHDPERIIGHTTAITNNGRRLAVAGEISGRGEDAEKVVELAAAGFPWQASIGAGGLKIAFLDEGETAKVNGQNFRGPIYIVQNSVLGEVSFVPVGADQRTAATIAATLARENHNMSFNDWLKAKGFDPAAITDTQRAPLLAQFNAEIAAAGDPPTDPAPAEPPADPAPAEPPADPAPAEPPADPPADASAAAVLQIRAAAADELDRQTQMRTLTVAAPQLTAQAIREGWSAERAELETLRAARPATPFIQTGENGQSAHALEAALCLTAGIPETMVAESYDENTMDAANGRDLRGAGIHTLLFDVIHAAGMHVRPGRVTDDTIRAAFQADRKLQAAGGFSTVTLTGILGAVANKSLLASYMAVAAIAQFICGRASHNNFQTHTKFRLTAKGAFEEVGPTGELKHAELSEDSYTNKLATYGKMITLTRQQIINDNMGAFLQLPRLLGRKAALAVERAVLTLVAGAETAAFFATANANLKTGTTSALSIAALSAAEQAFIEQTDGDSDPILLNPAILLVPPALKVTAELLFNEVAVSETTTANKPKPARNPHAGKFKPYCSPFLSNTGITGYSSTAWYMLADPADVAAFELAWLNGKNRPTIEGGKADFDVLGASWRAFLDFGCARQDPNGAVKSTGTT